MRGTIEKECLYIVLDLLYENGILADGTRVLDIEENDLPLDYLCVACIERFFGFSLEMLQEFENVVLYSMLYSRINDDSKFPDFKAKNGFIEHFEITSSKETRKGSKDKAVFGKTVSKIRKDMIANDLSYEQRTIESINHSYSWFVGSFKSNWEHHVDSLDAYDGNKDVGVFLIDFRQNFLLMHCDQLGDIKWPDGVSVGDLWTSESNKKYRLSRDKALLEYIHQYKDKVKYVIFVYDDCDFEVISIQNIPLIVKLLPYSYLFESVIPGVSMLTTVRYQQSDF